MKPKYSRILYILLAIATTIELLVFCVAAIELVDGPGKVRIRRVEEVWALLMLPTAAISLVFQIKAFPRRMKAQKDEYALEEDLFDVWDERIPRLSRFIVVGHVLNAFGLTLFFIRFFNETGKFMMREMRNINGFDDLLPFLLLLIAILSHAMLYWQWADYARRLKESPND